jgi:hypothetical protein
MQGGRQLSSASILALQRQVGNRAVTSLIRSLVSNQVGDAGETVAASLTGQPRTLQRLPGPQPVAPALEAAAEADADRVAERAMRRSPETFGTRGGTAWPARIPSPLAEALAPDLGDVRRVEIHSGGDAARSADAIGALAYSQPGTVTVGSGAPALGSVDGRRLLAHEATHAARHRSRSDADGRQLVHAKLAGTLDALIAQGDTEGIGRRRRTHWDRILSKMLRYENTETFVTNRFMNAQGVLRMTDKGVKTMIYLLKRVEAACQDWRKANDEAGARALAEEWHSTGIDKSKRDEDKRRMLQGVDTRNKAGRRQAISMLLPRIRSERASLEAGTWLQGMTLSETTKTSAGASASGAMNTVVEQKYTTEQGAFAGFFKEEKGFDVKPVGHSLDTGIKQADPNFGARAVAMSRIDQLLKTNLMVRTEFATSGGKMGTVAESARGTSADKIIDSFVLTTKERNRKLKPGETVISLEDPVLQKALNQMQIIDAICGQLDRHAGNWFVQTDKAGNVTGVKGMDLDMAFGKDLMDPNGPQAKESVWYRGMPEMVDAELGERILQLSVTDIEGAVKGLLGDDEVRALVSRFTIVQNKILAVQQRGGLTKKWNEQTAAASRPKTYEGLGAREKTYQQYHHIKALTNLETELRNAVNIDRTAEMDKLSDPTKNCLEEFPDGQLGSQRAKLFYAAAGLVQATLYPRVVTGNIEPDSGPDVAWAMMDALLAALDQDDTAKQELKNKFSGAKMSQYTSIAQEVLKDLAPPAFAKPEFGATPPPKAPQTPKA